MAVRSLSTRSWADDIYSGTAAYGLSMVLIVLGVIFGANFLASNEPIVDPVQACIRFDAARYVSIVDSGYAYEADAPSTVAFFPAFPVASAFFQRITSSPVDEAALVTANFFLVVAFVFFSRWIRLRWPTVTEHQLQFTLIVFALWPMGFFLRMPYAESMMVMISLLLLIGVAENWPILLLAFVAGVLSAVRPVGVAGAIAVLAHVLCESQQPKWRRAATATFVAPITVWGLGAYMLFQHLEFGNALAFAQTQDHWSMGSPARYSLSEKLLSLITFDPILSVYEIGNPRSWTAFQGPSCPLFNVMFWNPIFFVAAIVLTGLGRFRNWLSTVEFMFATTLLAIPYFTRAYEMSMGSHGRFAVVVMTSYLVLGRVLTHASFFVQLAWISVSGALMVIFMALYAGNRFFF